MFSDKQSPRERIYAASRRWEAPSTYEDLCVKCKIKYNIGYLGIDIPPIGSGAQREGMIRVPTVTQYNVEFKVNICLRLNKQPLNTPTEKKFHNWK